MAGITLLLTLTLIALLETGVGEAHEALLINVTDTTSALTKSEVVNTALFVPTLIPFFFHW